MGSWVGQEDICVYVCVCVCVLVNLITVGQTLTQLGEHNYAERQYSHKQLIHGDPGTCSEALKLA